MADPAALTVSHGIAAAIGGAVVGAMRLMWGRSERSIQGQLDALRETNTALREQLAVTAAAAERWEATALRLGAEKDQLGERLRKFELWAARVVVDVHGDQAIDDALVQDPPTGVHDLARLIGPRKSSPPKGIPATKAPEKALPHPTTYSVTRAPKKPPGAT
jgi:hypothetical protein